VTATGGDGLTASRTVHYAVQKAASALALSEWAQYPGRCQAESGGQAVLAAVACDHVYVVLAERLAKGATGLVTVTFSGGFPGSPRAITATVRARARWRVRVLVPGRDHEPGDRWTVDIPIRATPPTQRGGPQPNSCSRPKDWVRPDFRTAREPPRQARRRPAMHMACNRSAGAWSTWLLPSGSSHASLTGR
jgi:hypothetical protein